MIVAAALVGALAAAAPRPSISDLQEIALHSGLNFVPALTPDGRDGVIVSASPHVETAGQSHTDFIVLVKPVKPNGAWAPARFVEYDKPVRFEAAPADMVSDAPHTGEDQLTSLRFFRGRVDGVPALLAIKAARDFVLPIPDASHVTVDVFRLKVDPAFGEELFARVRRTRTARCYGNADLGLSAEYGVPPPAGYEGPTAAAPCGKP